MERRLGKAPFFCFIYCFDLAFYSSQSELFFKAISLYHLYFYIMFYLNIFL